MSSVDATLEGADDGLGRPPVAINAGLGTLFGLLEQGLFAEGMQVHEGLLNSGNVGGNAILGPSVKTIRAKGRLKFN